MDKIPTGSKILDTLLGGGYETGIVTTIYGPAGSGKTTLCILCAVTAARNGKKILYIDTEGGFSVERLQQICGAISQNYTKILAQFIFLKPTNFQEQKQAFEKLKDMLTDKINLIIIDSIAMLYRLEMGRTDDVYETNRELGRQLGFLIEIARKQNISVLITNQVYSDFEEKDKIHIVGGDILKYQSKCLLELQVTPEKNRRLIVQKHRHIPQEREILYKIVDGGIIGTRESKGFKLF